MQSNIANIKTDGVFVTLPLDVQEELVSLCKMYGICPEWMSEGLNAKVELNQYEELRLLLRNNGEQDLPGLVAFLDSSGRAAFLAPDELTEEDHFAAYEGAPEEFHSQPSSIRMRHKNN